MDPLAVGVPVLTGPAQGWNFWPFIGIPVALLIAFYWLRSAPEGVGRVSRDPRWVCSSADAVSAWGVLPVAGGTAVIVAASALALGRLRRRHPPTV